MDKIDDDEIYDLILTYRLPRKAPFDLKDTVNEARFKCIFKWLQETGNSMYKTVFEEEVRAKVEEKINAELFKKVDVLQRKIKRCNECNKPSSTLDVTNVTSLSTFTSSTHLIGEPNSLPNVEAPPSKIVEEFADFDSR